MTEAALPPPTAPAGVPVAAPQPPAPGLPVARQPRIERASVRPALLIAGLLAALVFGSDLINEAIPARPGLTPGDPLPIGPASQITPLDGWTTPGDPGTGSIQLRKGAVAVDITEVADVVGAGSLAETVREQFRAASVQFTASPIQVGAGEDGSSARFTYQQAFEGSNGSVEGELTTVVVGSTGIVADAWAPIGMLETQLEEVRAMLGSLEIAR